MCDQTCSLPAPIKGLHKGSLEDDTAGLRVGCCMAARVGVYSGCKCCRRYDTCNADIFSYILNQR